MRYRLDLGYDGTRFAGWARQPDRRTVQGELEAALGLALRRPEPRLTVAGRTDAGVHARHQVAHVDLDEPLDPAGLTRGGLVRRIAGVLTDRGADDVAVHAVAVAPAGFDARFAAVSRSYDYRVADRWRDPLRRHDTLWHPRPLDVAAMRAAAAPLPGLRDFAAYCRRREGATTVRTLLRATVTRGPDDTVVVGLTADAFCHQMVRSLVGALLAVGDGRRPVSWPEALLATPSRAAGVVVVPPRGLTLTAVTYPPDAELAARTERTRARRDAPAAG